MSLDVLPFGIVIICLRKSDVQKCLLQMCGRVCCASNFRHVHMQAGNGLLVVIHQERNSKNWKKFRVYRILVINIATTQMLQ